MAALSPVLPIVSGNTKFQPVYVGDVAAAIEMALTVTEASGRTYEIAGPDVKSFRQLIEIMLKIINRRSLVWDIPLSLAKVQAACLERLPGKLLTLDQIKLLQCDNIVSQGSFGLASLGIVGTPMDLILNSYLDRYRPSGARRNTY
jgi:NADH dehydrogenase